MITFELRTYMCKNPQNIDYNLKAVVLETQPDLSQKDKKPIQDIDAVIVLPLLLDSCLSEDLSYGKYVNVMKHLLMYLCSHPTP